MAKNKKESAIRDYVDALEKKDIDRALTFFTDDAVWINSEGTFTGMDEIRNYTIWMLGALSGLTFTDNGIGILVNDNKAVYQHIFEGLNEGTKIKVASICTYEFDGDKCVKHFTTTDRLTMSKQAATGFFEGKAVNAIVKRVEKGLH